MREIKFRAWDKRTKKMWVDDFYKISFSGVCGNPDSDRYSDALIANENLILMQFTGLKDKNGKDICEGDIVKETTESEIRIYKIIWKKYDCCFVFKPVNFKSTLDFNMGSIYTEVEIIGNIYENPELLEGEK